MLTDYSPSLPYYRKLHENAKPGFKLTVIGHVPHDCTNFVVNLRCGKQRPGYPEPNIAFHISVRAKDGVIVRNSLIATGAKIWGPEERGGGFPLQKNQPFQIDVIAEAYAFKINMNNKHFAEFKYRLPVNTISFVEIKGDVNIHQVNAGMIGSAPVNQRHKGHNSNQRVSYVASPPPPPYSPYPTPGLPLHVNSPPIPTTVYIPGNMHAGMLFSFSGMANHGEQRFHINWNTVNDDVAFQFNPRMNELAVVRNTRQGGRWLGEERHEGSFPFYPGQVFHMLVRVHATHFEVMVNGHIFTTYNHRIHPINMVKSIAVEGGVTMHSINIAN